MDMGGPAPGHIARPGTNTAPSLADIEAIGACPHPVLRNLQITQAYHELSAAAAGITAPGANWCTFATWASKQAGQTIRGDDLGRKIEEAFAGSEAVHLAVTRIRDLRRALGRAVDASTVLGVIREACAPLLTVAHVADAVARGNKKVFDEIGREFARLLAVLGSGGAEDGAIEGFCGDLRPGDAPEGQRLLAAAFREYPRARQAADHKARAERMLLANLRIGLHEQTRLQPEIAEALNAPVPDPAALRRRLAEALFPAANRVVTARLARTRAWSRALDEICGRLVDRLRAIVRAAVTEELMTLTLPGGTLRLGADLTGAFPEHLRTLGDPELVDFLRAIDPTEDTPLGSGADDWADLPDRMHFIADLFRMQHENAALFQQPFTPEQLQAIADGRTPDGRL
jgi:hypothetical protein